MTTLCYMNTCSCTFYLSQEGNVWIVHMIGAFLAFVFGGVYCCFQTYLSFKLPNIPGSTRNLRIGRLVICVLDFAFMVASILLRQQCVRPTKQNKTNQLNNYTSYNTPNNYYEISTFSVCWTIFTKTLRLQFFFTGVILVNVSFSLIRQKVFVTFRFTKSSSSIRPGCWTTKEPVSTSIPMYLKLNYGTSYVQLAEVLDGEHNLCDKIYPTY